MRGCTLTPPTASALEQAPDQVRDRLKAVQCVDLSVYDEVTKSKIEELEEERRLASKEGNNPARVREIRKQIYDVRSTKSKVLFEGELGDIVIWFERIESVNMEDQRLIRG
jgi:hypothetical protein